MKRWLSILLALCLALCPALPARAVQPAYVADEAGLLSGQELADLEAQAETVSVQYGCGVYVRLLADYRALSPASVRQAAETLYLQEDLGLGGEQSGVLLLLSMAERDYALIAYGWGNTAFTDYGKDVMVEEFLDNFRYDDWYRGLQDYIRVSGSLLEMAANGSPLDVSYGQFEEPRSLRDRLGTGGMILAIVGPALLLAFIACEAMRARMKSVRKATSARFYTVPNSLRMLTATDHFSHITQTRVRVESEGGRGGGHGGGTHISSSGFSGKSGKF